MKLTGYQVFDLLAGLRGLDGDDKQQPQERMKFGGTTTYSLAKNLSRVTKAAALLEQVKNKLVRQYGLDKTPTTPEETSGHNARMAEFRTEWDKVLQEEVDLVLTPIKVAELKLDENRVPIQALANLESILQGE